MLVPPESTVFIVDDDPAACESVAALVESMGVGARSFTSAEEFLQNYQPDHAGCLVTDVRMIGMGGLELQEQLARQGATLPVIVITAYADVPLTVRAMQAGAVTLLEKPCRDQELWESIRKALTLDLEHRRQQESKAQIQARMLKLSPGEREVLALLVAGRANKIIATTLDIGLRTVEKHRHNILEKMGAPSLAELVRMVVQVTGDEPPQAH